MKTNIDFFDVSSLLEEVSEQEALTLKGGDSDIAWENELEEVEIVAPGGDEDWDPYDPEDDWENEWDDDPWEDHGGSPETEPEDEQEECTCDMGSTANVATGDVKDEAGLLANLKTYLSDMKTHLNGLTAAQMDSFNITVDGKNSMLGTIGKVEGLISKVEDSNRVFRFESSGVAGNGGSISKDTGTNQYVISIDQGNNSYGVNELLVHELVHAGQVLDGGVGFDSNGQPTMVGMEDEVAAYQMMYDFGRGAAGPEKTATAENIKTDYPGMYDQLPAKGGSCPVHG